MSANEVVAKMKKSQRIPATLYYIIQNGTEFESTPSYSHAREVADLLDGVDALGLIEIKGNDGRIYWTNAGIEL